MIQNDLLEVIVKHAAVQFLQKNFERQIYCVLLAFIVSDLVCCCWYIIKQIFHAFFV